MVDASGKEMWKADGAPESARTPVRLAPATVYRWTLTSPPGAPGEATFETLPASVLEKGAKSRAAARPFSGRGILALPPHDLGATQETHEASSPLARERPDLPPLSP